MLGKIKDRPFYVRRTQVPSNFNRKPRLNYYSFFNQLRLVFFTDKGVFYGPPFVEQRGCEGDSLRQLLCPVLEVEFDFVINNVLVFDFEYSHIVRPNAEFPIEVFASEKIQFGFWFPFYQVPDRKHYDI